jgi:thiamine pyrophosphokinase
MRAVVFAWGNLADPAAFRRLLRPDDWIIGADSGANVAVSIDVTPHLIIGDNDSMTDDPRLSTVERLVFPGDKDETDLDLGIRHAILGGADEILIAAGLYGRPDHWLGNLLLPAADRLAGPRISLDDGVTHVDWLRGPAERTVHGKPGDTVSLMALTPVASDIHTDGLAWPLRGEDLRLGESRGLSNALAATTGRLRLGAGVLACIHLRSTSEWNAP